MICREKFLNSKILGSGSHQEKIKVVQFHKGFNNFFYKEHHSDSLFTEIDFLKKKFEVKFPVHPVLEPTGLNTGKKEKIMKILLPSFEDERKKLFWQFLPSNNNSKDLCVVAEV